MKIKAEPTHTIRIYIAGDIGIIKQACRKYCESGFCVTVTPTDFIYTRGEESGVCIGIVNYPRFPATKKKLTEHAVKLTKLLLKTAYQWTALIVEPEKTYWISRR